MMWKVLLGAACLLLVVSGEPNVREKRLEELLELLDIGDAKELQKKSEESTCDADDILAADQLNDGVEAQEVVDVVVETELDEWLDELIDHVKQYAFSSAKDRAGVLSKDYLETTRDQVACTLAVLDEVAARVIGGEEPSQCDSDEAGIVQCLVGGVRYIQDVLQDLVAGAYDIEDAAGDLVRLVISMSRIRQGLADLKEYQARRHLLLERILGLRSQHKRDVGIETQCPGGAVQGNDDDSPVSIQNVKDSVVAANLASWGAEIDDELDGASADELEEIAGKVACSEVPMVAMLNHVIQGGDVGLCSWWDVNKEDAFDIIMCLDVNLQAIKTELNGLRENGSSELEDVSVALFKLSLFGHRIMQSLDLLIDMQSEQVPK